MKTYQDLLKAGKGDKDRGEFCVNAIAEFKASREYRDAVDGESYYNKHNLTIEKMQKFLYTISGRKVPDLFSANYKLKTLFFRRLVIQQVQYVLGNGVKLNNEKSKAALGKDFDFKLQTAAKRAMAGGRAFGFWNLDHLEVFGYADTPAQPGFCPLYSENTSELMGGIRYWYRTIGDNHVFYCTLYEIDGYTEYQKIGDKSIEVSEEKRAYKKITTKTEADGIEKEIEENYPTLPIIPLYANDSHESELVGIRECIDCYDYVKSGLANDIDDTSGFYWLLKNEGGMEDADLAKFIQRMKTVRAAVVDGDDSEAEAHTLDVPTEARKTMLEILRADIYEDFQALDVKTLSAAAKTTQEIQAAYQAQDNKCADFEYYILDFVQKVLELAEIKGNPTLNWNRVVNQQEQTNMVLQSANYLSDECVINHLPFLTPEEAAEEIKKRKNEQLEQFGTMKEKNEGAEEEDEEELEDEDELEKDGGDE